MSKTMGDMALPHAAWRREVQPLEKRTVRVSMAIIRASLLVVVLGDDVGPQLGRGVPTSVFARRVGGRWVPRTNAMLS